MAGDEGAESGRCVLSLQEPSAVERVEPRGREVGRVADIVQHRGGDQHVGVREGWRDPPRLCTD